MNVNVETMGRAFLIRLAGRLDAHGSAQVEPVLFGLNSRSTVILDLAGVDYLSSAGIRLFVVMHKRLNTSGGLLVLVGLQRYCREVLKVSGLEKHFAVFDTVEAALADLGEAADTWEREIGKFTFQAGSGEPGGIEVLGRIEDVLAARITPELVRAKTFSAKEYSIGLGALGPNVEDVMPLLGEMITMGGTMVWLPTDGHDTPDFLVPRQESDEVLIRTGFNVSMYGKFNEYIEFQAAREEGATLEEIYLALFDLARKRRPDFRGALTLAMRAEMGQVLGCGVVKSPIAAQAPENGLWITDPSNYGNWFEADESPRHRDVSGLICGLGVDLSADLSGFDQEHLGATFYINPGNQKPAEGRAKLHNHGVFFNPFPLGERPLELEREIQSIVDEGQFIDMRHLFDRTTVCWALIGVVYVQDFRPDLSSR